MTKIYFDENIPIDLAHGMQHLDKPKNVKGREVEIHYLPDVLNPGTKDEDWIPVLGAEGAIVVTHDLGIHRKTVERDLYQRHGLSLIFFSPPSKNGYTYWEWVQQMIKRWEEIRTLALEAKRPFVYRYTNRKEKAERL